MPSPDPSSILPFWWLCLLSSSNSSQTRFTNVTGSHGPEFSFRLLPQWRYSSKYLFAWIFENYNYPKLIGLLNSLLRKVLTVFFAKKTCAELIVSFPLIRRFTIYSVVIIRANFILSLALSVYVRQHWFANAQQRRLSISSPSRGS